MRNNFRDTWVLTKANLIESYGLKGIKSFFSNGSGNLIKSITVALVILILFPMSYNFFSTIATIIYTEEGEGSIYMLINLSVFTVFVTTILTCIYKATSFLFSFKDYNMLSSFPVNMISILSSRMLILYISNLFINFIVGFTPLLVFGNFTNASITYYIFAIILFFFFPIVPLIIGSLVAFITTKAASKFKNTNYIITIASIILIVLSFYLTSVSQNMLDSQSIQLLQTLTNTIMYYLPGVFFIRALVEQSVFWFAVSILFNATLVVLFTFLFANNFRNLNSILTETHKKSNFKLKALSTSSQLMALYKKELKTFVSSHTYIINSSIGIIFFTMYSIYVFIFDIEGINWNMSYTLAFLFVALTSTTSVSFSIEGKSFYLLKVLPLKFSNIILSKTLLNLTTTLPLIFINSTILSVAFNVSFLDFFILLITLFGLSLLISLNGIVINLFFPKLNWKSHIEILKRSTSSFIAMVTNLIISIITIILNALLSSIVLIISIFLLCTLYWIFINKTGKELFNEI